ncbi:MAG: hypothetical protein NTY53_07950 [Kiritimatiellaeota bacterium]|nr:hypothetical protein [Kiritimatiellota bacterium]
MKHTLRVGHLTAPLLARGARKTVLWIDPAHNLVMVLLVQRWDMPGDINKLLYTTFLKAAVELYGRPH